MCPVFAYRSRWQDHHDWYQSKQPWDQTGPQQKNKPGGRYKKKKSALGGATDREALGSNFIGIKSTKTTTKNGDGLNKKRRKVTLTRGQCPRQGAKRNPFGRGHPGSSSRAGMGLPRGPRQDPATAKREKKTGPEGKLDRAVGRPIERGKKRVGPKNSRTRRPASKKKM